MTTRTSEDRLFTLTLDLSDIQAARPAAALDRLPLRDLDGIVLSLADAKQIDASALAFLVRLHSHLATHGKRLLLSEVPAPVREQLERIGLLGAVEELREPRLGLQPVRLRAVADARWS